MSTMGRLKLPPRILCLDLVNKTSLLSYNQKIIKAEFCSKVGAYSSDLSPSSSTVNQLNSQVIPLNKSLQIKLNNGLPSIIVPLPSRHEKCQFVLRPISDTVGTFCDDLVAEDSGIELVALYNRDGTRISKSTSIQHLLQSSGFRLRINDEQFECDLKQLGKWSGDFESLEKLSQLDDVRAKIASLYTILNVDEFKAKREASLLKNIENVDQELRPMLIVRQKIEEECERYTQNLLWTGFSGLCFQTGVFTRLTWWEYSWDIMEPVTYFTTFSVVLISLSYFLSTRQNFEYSSAHKRMLTKDFHRRAQKYNFDIVRYNELQTLSDGLKIELTRLRDPLSQHLPLNRLATLESDLAKTSISNIPKYKVGSNNK